MQISDAVITPVERAEDQDDASLNAFTESTSSYCWLDSLDLEKLVVYIPWARVDQCCKITSTLTSSRYASFKNIQNRNRGAGSARNIEIELDADKELIGCQRILQFLTALYAFFPFKGRGAGKAGVSDGLGRRNMKVS